VKILCSFPGRFGDLLWALPTVRVISEHYGVPVDLVIGREFTTIVPLIQMQSYIHDVWADPRWELTPEAIEPPPLPKHKVYDAEYHLAYTRWPEFPLPFETYDKVAPMVGGELDLTRPWIMNVPVRADGPDVACGWSDCHFELKYGVMELLFPLDEDHQPFHMMARGLAPHGSRWISEGGYQFSTWMDAAATIGRARVFLGDCSALHVLAIAMGQPVVLMEPMDARWNPIFYPLGKTGHGVELVTGHDGLPTFDARHCRDVLARVLMETRSRANSLR
jgi:hypothetical protein